MRNIFACPLLLIRWFIPITGSYYTTTDIFVNLPTTSFDLNGDDVDTPLSFLVIGDWGKGGESGSTKSRKLLTDSDSNILSESDSDFTTSRQLAESSNQGTNQVAVANAMAQYANDTVHTPSFVVALGDNFYTKGVSSTSDSLWTYLWSDIYLKYESLKSLPWYAVLGNHDYGYGATGVQAQVDKTFLENSTWNMPEKNYTKRFVKNNVTIQIIFIDTTTLAPSENGCCNTKSGISAEMQAERIKDQHTRIEAMLNATIDNPPNWLIVAGHYPVFSSGDHGDTDELLVHLLPLLEKYKVDIYLSGHDHISEHLQYGNTSYFVVGAGCMTDQLKATSAANLLWYGVGYSAFGVIEATPELLTMSFIDTNNEIKYSSSHVKIPPNITNTYSPSMTPNVQNITAGSDDDDDDDDDDDNNSTSTLSPITGQKDTATTPLPTLLNATSNPVIQSIRKEQRKSAIEKFAIAFRNNPEVSISTSCVLFAILAFLFTKMYYNLKISSKGINYYRFTSIQPHQQLQASTIMTPPSLLRIDIERGTRNAIVSNNNDDMYIQDKKNDRYTVTLLSPSTEYNNVTNDGSGTIYNKLHSSYSTTGIRSRRNINSSSSTKITTNNRNTIFNADAAANITPLTDDNNDDGNDRDKIRQELISSGFMPVTSSVYDNNNNTTSIHYNTSNSKDRTSDDQDSDGEYIDINDNTFTNTHTVMNNCEPTE